MRFLSNGDFGFPFTWMLFLAKQFYIWSYQTGSLNADGIMRMPGRLIDLAVFMFFGNLPFEYFFIFSSLAIVFASFLYFAHEFLEIKSNYTLLIGSLFYTFNPVFLGNLSKIGLILAAAMLPLCLVMVRKMFEQQRLGYLFGWLVVLNISLIHPFTFAVNLIVSGAYFVRLATLNRSFVTKNLLRFAVGGCVLLLLNAYFLLPLASMHTVSKNALSDSVTATSTDYTALVSVLNTGNIFTGFSLSKNVVKDYDFYNASYMNYYFVGVFGFYALLLCLYLVVGKRLNSIDKRRVVVLLATLLVLIAFATVTFMHIDKLIKLLINTPGGWALRSPLKWQLYIPLTLFGLFVLLVKQITSGRQKIVVYTCAAMTFVLMNGFLAVGIYHKLLLPRSVQYFGALQQMNLDHQNLLMVTDSSCWAYEQSHPTVMAELNQVLISQNIQVKRVSMADVDQVNLSSYNLILSCQGIMRPLVSRAYDYTLTKTFASNAFQLYTNQRAHPYVYASTSTFALTATSQISDKNDFVSHQLNQDFNFIDGSVAVGQPATGLQEIFENLTPRSISSGSITTSIPMSSDGRQSVYVGENGRTLYYSIGNGELFIATVKKPGYQPVRATGVIAVSAAAAGNKRLDVNYTDTAYQFQNLIVNPSFEQGQWQKKVGDCYDYDQEPQISMSIDTHDKTAGKQSLQLDSSNHIACTGPNPISVNDGQQYLLSFDYWSQGNDAAYYLNFVGKQSSSLSGRLAGKGTGWHNFTKVITVPSGSQSMQLQLEVLPDYMNETAGIARFDNFQLIAIPNVSGRFFAVDNQASKLTRPAKIDYAVINPTKTKVHIYGATTPFYLDTTESYGAQWVLVTDTNSAQLPVKDHLKLNGTMNGWYIDPGKICRTSGTTCTRNNDGSYDVSLVMEFTPQKWFYVGAIISAVTLIGGSIYFVLNVRKHPNKSMRYRIWS